MDCKKWFKSLSSIGFAGILATLSQSAMAAYPEVSSDSIGRPLSQIRISGNAVTLDKFILKWMALEPGQILTLEALKHAEQGLLDTELFKRIVFSSKTEGQNELDLLVTLEEKRFNLLLPRLSRNGNGDISVGARLRMHNILGANQTLNLLLQQEEKINNEDNQELRFEYSMPLYAKPYELNWKLSHIVIDKRVDNFDNLETANRFHFTVARDHHRLLAPWVVAMEVGIIFEDKQLAQPYPVSIDAPETGSFNRIQLGLSVDEIHFERYRRFGHAFSVRLDQGLDWLGSDYDSQILTVDWKQFLRLNQFDNFNYRLRLELANDSPFNSSLYGIGGSENIRGLENYDVVGDAKLVANLEYVYSNPKHLNLRHSFFVDIGNIYDDFEAIDLSDLKATVGVGVRWKIESFVKTDLVLDYGFDPRTNEGRLYGSTSLNF